MASYLEEREGHPQENDNSTRKSKWYVEVKNTMTPLAAGATKRLIKWLIRRLTGWLQTQCSFEI